MNKRNPDAYLEARIEAERVKMVEALTPEARRGAWHSMKALIESRSAVQVRQMEFAQRLRRMPMSTERGRL